MYDFSKMTIEEIEARKAAIAVELDKDGADLDKLGEETRAINAELEKRKADAKKREEIRKAVAGAVGVEVRKPVNADKTVKTVDEIRASAEYVEAFAKYIKTNDATEARALLTTNSNVSGNPGQLPVPTIIEEQIKTAWEKSGLLDMVRKTYVRGNLKVGFELSATDAAVHAEGTAAPAEEVLTLGVVTLVPQSIKKWIRISDEAYDLGGEEFLRYIYDEITHKIIMEAKRLLILAITSAPAANTATAIGVPSVTGAPTLDVVARAVALLSDEASNIAVVMNRQTHADFIAAIAGNGYLFDPFEGYAVHYDNNLPAYSAAAANAAWLIVGDFSGAQFNFPAGEEVKLKFDDLTEAQADLVKIVGRMFAAIGITAPGRFVKVTKANG